MDNNEATRVRDGGCLCEGVRYRLTGPCRDVINCFCGQCQKTSGHHFAATRVSLDQFELLSSETLAWYQSSESAKRGFCQRCGGNLFWQPVDGDTISVTAGTLDKPTGLRTTRNIFIDDMSDYHFLPQLSPLDGDGD